MPSNNVTIMDYYARFYIYRGHLPDAITCILGNY